MTVGKIWSRGTTRAAWSSTWRRTIGSARSQTARNDWDPYRLALHELGLRPEAVLFVAGSAFDLVGTAGVGLDTYWHNRVGLKRPAEVRAPLREARTLKELFAEF